MMQMESISPLVAAISELSFRLFGKNRSKGITASNTGQSLWSASSIGCPGASLQTMNVPDFRENAYKAEPSLGAWPGTAPAVQLAHGEKSSLLQPGSNLTK